MEPDAWLDNLLAHEARYYALLTTWEQTPCGLFGYNPELADYREANHALSLRDDGRGPEAVAREIVAFYRSRGLPPVADVDAIAERQGIGAALRCLGVTPLIGSMTLMRYLPSAPPILPARDIEIEMLTANSGPDFDAWLAVALSDEADDLPSWQPRATELEARSPDCRLYLGRVGREPAGTAELFSADGWGRIEMVVTYPDFRRRGVASALVARAIADSLALGHAETYLYAETGGIAEQIYLRLGFVAHAVNVLRRHKGDG